MGVRISQRQIIIHTALAAGGMLVWIVISNITGKSEPWDSDLFWSYGLLTMISINFIAAVLDPHRPVVKGLLSVALQPAAMTIAAGEIGSMLPFGLIVFALLGILYSAGGIIGVKIHQWYFRNNSGNI